MRWFACAVVLVGLLVLGVLVVVAGRIPGGAPSTDACVDLWNASRNATVRAQVAARSYPVAHIGGVFSEGREEGCSAWFVRGIQDAWALYSATRVPGQDRRLRWQLGIKGQRWEIEFPYDPPPQPNAIVLANGSLSLRDRNLSGYDTLESLLRRRP
jgi:hypothetical protein